MELAVPAARCRQREPSARLLEYLHNNCFHNGVTRLDRAAAAGESRMAPATAVPHLRKVTITGSLPRILRHSHFHSLFSARRTGPLIHACRRRN